MNKTSRQLDNIDYSLLQQCIHCGLCLPVCPTYDATKLEKNSPRGRISLMRAIADGKIEVTSTFGTEMYFCLGCLACSTACPAGVNYAELFEAARADIENSGVLSELWRNTSRWLILKCIFTRPRILRLLGRLLYLYQASGLQRVVRTFKLTILLPGDLRKLEPLTPTVRRHHSDELIDEVEMPSKCFFRVGLLTGCVQDLIYSEINRDTVDVLLAHRCGVLTPRRQFCCGSLHAHNGEWETARRLARLNIVLMERVAGSLENLDAIISNAGGCGLHLKNYVNLLQDDADFVQRARLWSSKVRDANEWLAAIGIRRPEIIAETKYVTYHESCHLCHGQKVSQEPREVLRSIPGVQLVELPESNWCCGSAGVYNITQPIMAQTLVNRKLKHIFATKASIVASANPGCSLQLEAALQKVGSAVKVVHPISLLASALRQAGSISAHLKKSTLAPRSEARSVDYREYI